MTTTADIRRRIHGRWCVYCGERATTEEHFPPRSCGARGWVIPACGECNALAGTEHPYRFGDRCAYVQEALRHRYHAFVMVPEGSLHALVDLDDAEWARQLEYLGTVRRLRKRLAWDARVYLSMIGYEDMFELEFEPEVGAEIARCMCGCELRVGGKAWCSDECRAAHWAMYP